MKNLNVIVLMICLVFMPTKKAQAFTLIELALVSIPLIISTNFLDGSGIEFNEPNSSDDPVVVLSKLSNTNQWIEITRAPYNSANGSYSFSNLNKNELAGQIIQLEVISGDLIGKKEIMKIDSNPSTEIQIDFNQNNTLKSFLIEHLRLEYNQTLSAENARAEIEDHLLQNTIDIPWSSDLEALLELVNSSNSSNSLLAGTVLETRELTLIESRIILAKVARSKTIQTMLNASFPIIENNLYSNGFNQRYYQLSNLVAIGYCLKESTANSNPLECAYFSNFLHFNQNDWLLQNAYSTNQTVNLLNASKSTEINNYLQSIGAENLFSSYLENAPTIIPLEITNYLASSLSAQQAYYFEQGTFGNTFNLIGLDPAPTSDVYSFSIVKNDTIDYSIAYTIANSISTEYKFLVGANVYDKQSFEFKTILCMADDANNLFSSSYYPSYDFASKILSCASGSSEYAIDLISNIYTEIFLGIISPSSALELKIDQAKNVVGSLTRAAQAYSLENGVLPSINSDLGVSVTSPTGYSLSKVNTGTVFYVIHDIDNVGSEYKFIISGTAIKADSSSVQILCMSDTAGILIDVSHYPAYNVGSETFSCASGTSVVP
jgi:hypothetical protein